ncbi:hypothetical protein [Tautonia plasticadhaerens]|uniref:Uncharacterized protein n=1 Tax=Tautonia plasticadhaerens TaxID=2527974 RepID=A0A518GUN7_9BACT|nr:hypothetical protein [Tautonia plasticadhaerens]QDV32292.1 hypothetical protein ElP_01200 [Tautonia plasticadhaerens]
MKAPRVRIRTVMIAIAVLTVLSYVAARLWAYYSLPANTRDVLARLDRPVRFPDPGPMPLAEALEAIREATRDPGDNGIPLYVDELGLQRAGATLWTEVRVDPGPMPAGDCLRRVLGPLGLDFNVYVRDGMLEVTTKDVARRARETTPDQVLRP